MTYQQTLTYLYDHLPMFSRLGSKAYKADLNNIIALCEALQNPHNKFPSVHIAGTNGKGSTSHMLAAIFQQCGYRTGLYTSPHLKDFRERIRVNGEMIPEATVTAFVEKTKTLSEEIAPSFFELSVAMAFDHFAAEKVDIATIETGLGGRLDSTNIITPVLSVITNIGYDHMNILGDTLEQIAFEKAGIIKNGIPAVIGETNEITLPVFTRKAAACGAPLILAEEWGTIRSLQQDDKWLTVSVTNKRSQSDTSYRLDLTGMYQSKNLRTVLAAVSALQELGFELPGTRVRAALEQVRSLTGLHGRWEVIARDPLVVLDVAHNEDGIRQVLGNIAHLRKPARQVHFVMGMVKDKDVEKVLSMLPADAHYYFSQANIPRALPAVELRAQAANAGLEGKAFDSVNTALAAARNNASPDDLVIVCGSVFLVGEVTV